MTQDPTSPVSSYRSRSAGFLRRHWAVVLLVGVIAVQTGPAAQATNGNPVIMGAFNQASGDTEISTTAGDGIDGSTTDPNSADAGVMGLNGGGGNAVEGRAYGLSARNGVYGHTTSSTASGVYGENNFGGYGVAGRATHNGVAVLADSADGTGTALRTTGKLEFQNRSGIATIASGQKSVTVTLAGVTATSMIMATVQRAGGFFASATPAAGSFTIYLNKAPVSPATVKVAYLVLN